MNLSLLSRLAAVEVNADTSTPASLHTSVLSCKMRTFVRKAHIETSSAWVSLLYFVRCKFIELLYTGITSVLFHLLVLHRTDHFRPDICIGT
jgi:hypothetical protein